MPIALISAAARSLSACFDIFASFLSSKRRFRCLACTASMPAILSKRSSRSSRAVSRSLRAVWSSSTRCSFRCLLFESSAAAMRAFISRKAIFSSPRLCISSIPRLIAFRWASVRPLAMCWGRRNFTDRSCKLSLKWAMLLELEAPLESSSEARVTVWMSGKVSLSQEGLLPDPSLLLVSVLEWLLPNADAVGSAIIRAESCTSTQRGEEALLHAPSSSEKVTFVSDLQPA
mmetsp:Transcript_17390/g.47444  ORF Transcript_17390/g.47444 Transcript_17390/m.47444 type:complete len:231 (-) Transcript_17390:302-994(-)